MSFPLNFFRKGNINLFLGNPGEGKTHAVVYLAHHALDYKFNVLHNIQMFRNEHIEMAKEEGWLNPKVKYLKIPKNFIYVPLASELVKKASQGTNNIVIVDEGNITASSSRATGHTAVQMKFMGFSIRKIGACMINIAQDETQMVPTLRANLVTYKVYIIRKPDGRRDLKFMKAKKSFNKDSGESKVIFADYDYRIGVPSVHLPYDTIHPGGFIFDINLEKLYMELAQLSYEKQWDSFDIRKHIGAIVDNMVADKKIDEYLKQKKFMMSGTVADLFNTSVRTIENWVHNGKLTAIKTDGGKFLFSRKEVKKKAIEMGIL